MTIEQNNKVKEEEYIIGKCIYSFKKWEFFKKVLGNYKTLGGDIITFENIKLLKILN